MTDDAGRPSEAQDSSYGKRTVAWMVVGALLLGMLGTVMALTVTPMDPDRMTLWNAPTADSHFTVNEYDVELKGKDKVEVSVTLKNTDTATAQEANATVQLLNSTGAVIQESYTLTGSVGADSTWSYTFQFSETDLASKYHESVLIVQDVS